MIATTETVEILDQCDFVSQFIIQSNVYERFLQAKQALNRDKEAQQLIAAFQQIKEQYEDVQRFGRYHPDYNHIMKSVRAKKREVDMNECVAQYKLAERALQSLLDDISEAIAYSVSPNIKVPRDGLALKDTGGGCGCGSGGGCGCS
ncbi:YlbF family regulator [Pontibacillus litoralis]|uniref:Regulator n=1 Tax=Pontibacillus litoralis JSM 072002 TaxID=1385512 RepID=A0A0A5GBJ9_9BACI|nr:YlbF family regulator [Pontibacillus litoralis]KGX88568.1 regulator [Pontibacillus litoralis JSM 072002]